MSNFCILRIKKLHADSNVAGALAHHLRTRETDNADPEKIRRNWYSGNEYPKDENGRLDRSSNEDIEARRKMKAVALAKYRRNLPEKIRKNAVRSVEFMMTVSPEVMSRKDFNSVKYLNDCANWVREKFGKENVFFVAHHNDETTPHISILITPKDENGKLNARKFFGGREKMTALQDEFYEKVGKEFGLERGIKGSKAKHKDIKTYYSEIQALDAKFSLPKRQFLEGEEEYQERAKIALRPVLAPLVGLENEKLRFKQEVSNSLKYLKSEKARLEDEKQEIKNIKDTYYALKYNSPEFLRRKADELEQQKKNQTKERKQGYER